MGAVFAWMVTMEATSIMAYHLVLDTSGAKSAVGWLVGLPCIITTAACYLLMLVLTDKQRAHQEMARTSATIALGSLGTFLAALAVITMPSKQPYGLDLYGAIFIMLVALAAMAISAASRAGKVTELYYKARPVTWLERYSFFVACAATVALYPYLDWRWLSSLITVQVIMGWFFLFRTVNNRPKFEKTRKKSLKIGRKRKKKT